MDKATFVSIISDYLAYKEKMANVSNNLGVDLINSTPVEFTERVFDNLMHVYFNSDNANTIIWWCTDKQANPSLNYIVNEKVVPSRTIDDLWEIVKPDKDVTVKIMNTIVGYLKSDKIKDFSNVQVGDSSKKVTAKYISNCIDNKDNVVKIELTGKDVDICVYNNCDLASKLLVNVQIHKNDTTVYNSLNEECDIMYLSTGAIAQIYNMLKSNHRDLWTFVKGTESQLPTKSLEEVDISLLDFYPYRKSYCLDGINFYTYKNREYICTIKKNSDNVYYNDNVVGKIKDLSKDSIQNLNDILTITFYKNALSHYTKSKNLELDTSEYND